MNRAERRRLMRIGEKGLGYVTGGPKAQAIHKYHADDLKEPPAGEHMWTTMALFRCADPTADEFHADLENLLTIEGPGCYRCEQPYSAAVAAKPCPGEPG